MAIGVVAGLAVAGFAAYLALRNPDADLFPAIDGDLEAGAIEVGGENRTYELYRPAVGGERPADGLPLVVNLHGLGSGPRQQLDRSRFDLVADDEGVVVVFPQARPGGPLRLAQWDATLDDGRSDVEFIEALLDELIATEDIDPARVYVTGLSYGAIMAYTLICTLPDRFAAAAVVAGGLARAVADDCQTGRPVPVLHIHGDDDGIVPFTGIGDLAFGATETVTRFAERNGCEPAPASSAVPDRDPSDGTTTTRFVYPGCAEGTSVESLVVHGGGHTWPGGTRPYRIFFGAISRDFSASQIIWNFFALHRVPSP